MITQLAFDEYQEVLISMKYRNIDIDQSFKIKRDPDVSGIVYLYLRRDHPLFNIMLIRNFAYNMWKLIAKSELEELAENFYESVTDKF